MRLYIPLPALWSTFGDLIDASSCHLIYYEEEVIVFCKIFAFGITELLITLGGGGRVCVEGCGIWRKPQQNCYREQAFSSFFLSFVVCNNYLNVWVRFIMNEPVNFITRFGVSSKLIT